MTGSISTRQSVMLPSSGPTLAAVGPIALNLRRPALEINSNNPLSKGLVLCAVPIPGGFLDLITGMVAFQPTTTSFRKTVRSQDPAVPYNKWVSTKAFFPAQTKLDNVTGPYSIFVDGCLETNASFATVLSSYDSTNGKGMYFFYDDSLTVVNTFVLSSFNTGHQNASSVLGANSEQFAHRVMVTADGTNWKFYYAGILVRTLAISELPAASVLRQTYLGDGGSTNLVLAWDRALTVQEYAQLWDNPRQVIQPSPQHIWGDR